MTKFKIGDKVKIKDTENVRHYHAEKSIGKTFVLDNEWDDAADLNSGGHAHPFNNKYRCNYLAGDLEIIKRVKVKK